MTAARDINFRIVRPSQGGAQTTNQVSVDLEDIFRSAPQPASETSAAPRAKPLRPRPRRANERSIAGFGLAAAAVLVGLTVGLMALRHPASAPAATAVAPITIAQAAPAPVAPPADPVATPPATQARTTSREPRPVQLQRVAARTPAARCAGLPRGAQARCAYPAIVAADRRLRSAYVQAMRAGVPRPVLVDYRNRWASLRHDANYRPAHTAAAFGQLADDLQRVARRGRS